VDRLDSMGGLFTMDAWLHQLGHDAIWRR